MCLAIRVMLNGMTKVATPLLASSSSLGRPIGAPRVFNSKYLLVKVMRMEGNRLVRMVILEALGLR